MSLLQDLLADIEDRIDLDHLASVEDLHRRALNFEPVERVPLTLAVPPQMLPVERYPYSEAFDDPEKMMSNELVSSFAGAYTSVRLKDDFACAIRSNHGIGVIASLFGLRCRIIQDNMPWVDSLGTEDEVEALVDRGMPEIAGGLVAKVVEMHQFYNDTLADFPRCCQAVRITQPDLQGPFDIAHLIWGTDIYYALYDRPELVHRLLDLVTDTYIAVQRHIRTTIDDSAGEGFVYLHGGLCGGHAILKDDSSTNVSATMYEEFSKPYNTRIQEALDSGGIHFCGNADQWRDSFLDTRGLRCIDFGNPEMMDVDEWYRLAKARSIPLTGLNLTKEEILSPTFRDRFPTGVALLVSVDSLEEGQWVLDLYRGVLDLDG